MDSLRVNLDMGKAAYGWMIMKDENIPGTVVRTSTIPEELGRLVYLLTDKTGKCCKGEKKSHLFPKGTLEVARLCFFNQQNSSFFKK